MIFLNLIFRNFWDVFLTNTSDKSHGLLEARFTKNFVVLYLQCIGNDLKDIRVFIDKSYTGSIMELLNFGKNFPDGCFFF